MNIALLGYGEQGRSAYDYYSRDPANQLTICDQNLQLIAPEGAVTRLGPDYLRNLDDFDLLIRSPGVHPRDIVAANTPGIINKVTTVTNEFLRVCPTFNVIGVTGTKGKGTTSTLIARMLESAGKTVHLGGNIGIAPLDMLFNKIQPDDWVVLELANFQLIDLQKSPHIAVCLMVVPEHLNWHTDLQEYISAKQQLFATQTTADVAIYYADSENSKTVASAGQAAKIPYFAPPGAVVVDDSIAIDGQSICRTDDIKLLGKHNWQNVCAAVTAVWQVTQDVAAIRSAISTFEGLPYHLELVGTKGGVQYYNDSFGTTPETAIVALEAFAQPKVLILGGSDKGATYTELAQAVQSNNVHTVIAIGQTGPAISSALANAGYTTVLAGASTMAEITAQAQRAAHPGDVVLLSTGCASFDMFPNYKVRGQQFTAAVQALA